MRNLLIISLLINSLLAGTIGFMLLRLGGWKYALYRFWHDETGLYVHRKGHFQTLPIKPGAVILVGDSQVEQAEWSELLGPQPGGAVVLNRGIVGDQIEGVRSRLPEILRHQPSKVFLCVGVNDLLLDRSYQDIEHGYRDAVRKLRNENRSGQLFLTSVLPVNNNIKRIGIENSQIRELNARLQQIARDYSAPYIDLAELLTDQEGNLAARFTDDGIHLNALGYQKWKEAISPFLK